MNIMYRKVLKRRCMLKAAGVAMALPWLEAMAGPGKAAHPVRLGFLYVPNGIQAPELWVPKVVGNDYELPPMLSPLSSLKQDFSVLTGLASLQGSGFGDGGNHAPAAGSYLTGFHPEKSVRCNISVDQIAANKIGALTRLPSLEIGPERRGQISCDGYPCVVVNSMSWRTPTQPLPRLTSPREIFERLFGDQKVDIKQNRKKTSILDTVRTEAKSLLNEVGSSDRHKLDEYLTSVREIEQRIERSETMQPPKLPEGVSKPEDKIPDDFGEYLRQLGELMVLAFQTDSTRICTFVYDYEGSNRAYPEIGINTSHHQLTHELGNQESVSKIIEIQKYHLKHFAYLLDRLKSIKEGDRTLLDNCIISYGSALGKSHDHYDLQTLLAGRGGGSIKPGKHLAYSKNTPLANLWLAMLERAEVPASKLGDSTGVLGGLS